MSLSADRTTFVTVTSGAGFDRRDTVLLTGGLISMVALVVLRAAWVSDAAYLTLRVADNFIHGYGLRWNVVERVQVCAHPLWLLLVMAAYAVTREGYFTALVLDLGLTIVALLVLVRLARSPLTGALAIVALLFSTAFVDFSTSGLENPLSHALVAAFVLVALRERAGGRAVAALALVASFAMLAHPDNAFVVLPAVALAAVRVRSWRGWAAVAVGLLPLIAWEIFAVVYYGFPLPNAAYARMSAGLPGLAMMQQGVVYLIDSIGRDPVTLVTTIAGVVLGLAADAPGARATALGVVLYLAYVVLIGGDEMSGRLLTTPLVTSACLIAWSIDVRRLGRARVVPMVLVILIGVWSPGNPLVVAPFGDARRAAAGAGRTVDQRRLEDPAAGLSHLRLGVTMLNTGRASEASALVREGRTAVAADVVGVLGFIGGPRLHIVDTRGATDPLMARLAPDPRVPPVGAVRPVPDGYLAAIQSGAAGTPIRDLRIAACYDHLSLIDEAPIWSWPRFKAILRANVGQLAFSCR
jgi:arabinofuranosyltransferase